ncbi:MAG: GTP 3',8-cyclase MoaA [Syntrophothermus sp.]|uniref:GTP 3',8-cyclase MoaA n=1 Tax=Syntrophothermus sp. TaxID=2736299 RepID=UPI00257CE178|nr:GTP 3',8-cyclase MoaA [Syntrophothermus sp.]NSW82351.1 GTP 3',8-cyclase MoaA [Syntrophothermus sp.]
MLDSLGREINYLRVSVTDRCNLRCRYCMPETGIELKPHSEILSLEEIHRIIETGTRVGIRKVRLTGGEPLIRRNLSRLVQMISTIDLIDDIAITTNGLLFPEMAGELKEAGLHRLNVSLDTMNPEKYSFITRNGSLKQALRAIETALALEFHPVKINTVVIRGINDDEIMDFCRLAYNHRLHVRFIEFMPVGELGFWSRDKVITCDEIQEMIKREYRLSPWKLSRGNGPAKSYRLEGGQGSIGFISPMSNHFCHECNRLRLTADGKLRGCLYDRTEIDLKQVLRQGGSDEEILQLFIKAINLKPNEHKMGQTSWGSKNRKMYQIGG